VDTGGKDALFPQQALLLQSTAGISGNHITDAPPGPRPILLSQLRELGPRVARHEDPSLVSVLNKISDMLAKDQVGG
jgi:hypothetical protein